MSSEIRLKEGELRKYRNRWHGWKKYYFKFGRSYLHYFETKYTATPIGTITRGEISEVAFSKDQPVVGFEIHLKSGEIWYLEASSHEERMDWMRTLKPDANIVDPFKDNTTPVNEQRPFASAPPSQGQFPANYQRIYPNLPNNQITNVQTGHGSSSLSASIPPPPYDDINYRT